MRMVDFHWLAPLPDASTRLRQLTRATGIDLADLTALAGARLDFVQTNQLDRVFSKNFGGAASNATSLKTVRLAFLSSSTADHLLPGLRVAGLRRNMRVDVHLGNYGQYLQELQDTTSPLYAFAPDVLVFAFHAEHLFGASNPTLSSSDADALVAAVADKIKLCWRRARDAFKGQIIQQSVIPVYHPLLGSNEHRLPGSGASLVAQLNAKLRTLSIEEGVDLLALEHYMANDGMQSWHDPGLWHRAKQEISPIAAPAYGDLVLRLIAAQQGRSAKCLVLDLDNTLWGGVIGDDGLEGIVLGQGSALGEAHVAFQRYALDLSKRGIILAVCSKNDEANARAPFEKHPDMVLKSADIACFVANWRDKASNIRAIAEQLNIGVDSIVFADDNPFERNIVRRELPMVSVPELPEDAAFYAQSIADAGYFEATRVTTEDFERNGQYRANAARESLRAVHSDLSGYLASLDMQLQWMPFDRTGQQRIVQLINKTNQFNLRTRRYTDSEAIAVMEQPRALTLQLRLVDQFGDNGIISIVIGIPEGDALMLDTWLMSCRVLGRQVEEATMNLVVEEAAKLGATRLIGEYLPTKKNGMVKDHYRTLGFQQIEVREDGASRWELRLEDYKPFKTSINTTRSEAGG